jgi:hypothetical protein
MKITIDHAGQFRDEFAACGRENQFSYEALGLLFDYLEKNDSDYELDVIALCCEYSEYMPESIIESYGIEYDENEPAALDAATAYLEANTTIIGTTSSGAIVYASNF